MKHKLIPEADYASQAMNIAHAGDCMGTWCPACGCCIHCAEHTCDCSDPGCGCCWS